MCTDTYRTGALGEPSLDAGQPSHLCLGLPKSLSRMGGFSAQVW